MPRDNLVLLSVAVASSALPKRLNSSFRRRLFWYDIQMNNEQVIQKTKEYVAQKKFKSGSAGHDWWHIYRVWKLARRIAATEDVDMFIVELGALLHDIADWKFN